jgi:hypothetical protein
MNKFMWQRECERLILVRDIEHQERILSNRLNVLHEKPAPIESFRTRTFEEVPTRPVVPLNTACNPGEKLPPLIFKGADRPWTSPNRQPASLRSSQAVSSSETRTPKETPSAQDEPPAPEPPEVSQSAHDEPVEENSPEEQAQPPGDGAPLSDILSDALQ